MPSAQTQTQEEGAQSVPRNAGAYWVLFPVFGVSP